MKDRNCTNQSKTFSKLATVTMVKFGRERERERESWGRDGVKGDDAKT